MLKGEPPAPPPSEKGEAAAAAGCCGCGAAAKGDAGDGALAAEAKPGDTAAKGLIGNACALDALAAPCCGAIWNGEGAGAGAAAVIENGEGDDDAACAGAGAAPCPPRAWAINPGSLAAGSGTKRGSCGEIGTWNNAGQTR